MYRHQQNELKNIYFIGDLIQIIWFYNIYHNLYPGKVLLRLIIVISSPNRHGQVAHKNIKLRLMGAPPL